LERYGRRNITMSPPRDLTAPRDFALHGYGTGERLPIGMPVFRPCGNPTEKYRILSGFYSTGDSSAWTLSDEQFREFLQIQALGQVSPDLLRILITQGTVGHEHEGLSAKRLLLKQILVLRDSIEADRGILPESYPLIRQAREE
jgi:hypothetical protein